MWNKVSEKELPYGEEVIAFNKKWIDEDFNPNGTRVGFLGDDGFISAMYRRIPVLLDQFLYAEGKYVLNKDNITQDLGPGLIHAYTRFCYASYYLQLRSDRIALKAYIPKGTRFFVSDDHETIAADKIFISSDKVTCDYGLTEEQVIILLGTHKNGTETEKR